MIYSFFFFFFFNDTATTEIYTLSLHDALPIFSMCASTWAMSLQFWGHCRSLSAAERLSLKRQKGQKPGQIIVDRKSTRLNSSHSQISYAVFCLKKKKKKYLQHYYTRSSDTS